MERVKIPFFKRVKKAITDFDSYSDFAVENIGVAIRYFAKIIIIFAIIISIAFCYKFSTIINNEEELQIIYNQLSENGIELKPVQEAINIIKQEIGNTQNAWQFYVLLVLSMSIYMYCAYFLLGLLDIILISILGLIISRISRIILKYKPIFIMSVYAVTLPIILNCIYIVVNTLTGFTINNFSLVYNAIAYIYIITAILMIKTDFIHQQTELIKIYKEQEKIRQEQTQEEPEDKQGDEDQDDKDKGDDEEQPQE